MKIKRKLVDEMEFKFVDLLRETGLQEGERNTLLGCVCAIKKNNPSILSKLAQSQNVFQETLKEFEMIPTDIISLQAKSIVSDAFVIAEKKMSKQLLSQVITMIMQVDQKELATVYSNILATYVSRDSIESITNPAFNEIAASVIAAKQPESVYDGTAGYGFTASAVAQNIPNVQIHLQEINSQVAAALSIKMYLEDQNAEIAIADTVTNPTYKRLDNTLVKHPAVIVDAPLGLRLHADEVLGNDLYNRNVFGKASKSQGSIFFVNNGLAHLEDDGIMVAHLATATLFRSGAEKTIRQNYLNFDVIEAIVQMPVEQMQPFANVSTSVVVFNKNKSPERKGKILMVNAMNEELVGKRHDLKLSESSIEKIKQVLSSYEEIDTFSKIVDVEAIVDENLTPERYVFKSEVETEAFGTVNVDLESFKAMDTVAIENMATAITGYNALPKDVAEDGEYAVLKITDVVDGEVEQNGLTRYKLPARAKATNSLLQKGDVIISIRGGNRKVAVFDSDAEDVLISQNFLGIRCSDELDPYFLKLYLESPIAQFYFEAQSSGSTVVTLPKSAVMALPVPKIPIEQQKALATKYKEEHDAINTELKRLEEREKELKLEAFERMNINLFMKFQ